jgi:hypothetical protein
MNKIIKAKRKKKQKTNLNKLILMVTVIPQVMPNFPNIRRTKLRQY